MEFAHHQVKIRSFDYTIVGFPVTGAMQQSASSHFLFPSTPFKQANVGKAAFPYIPPNAGLTCLRWQVCSTDVISWILSLVNSDEGGFILRLGAIDPANHWVVVVADLLQDRHTWCANLTVMEQCRLYTCKEQFAMSSWRYVFGCKNE